MQALQALEGRLKFLEVKEFAKKLLENLNERLEPIESNEMLKLSMLIDPRFAYSEEFLSKFDWDDLENIMANFIFKG